MSYDNRTYQVYTKSNYTVAIPTRSGNKKAKRPEDNTVKGCLSKKSKHKIWDILNGWNEAIRCAPASNKKKWTIQPRFTLLTLTLSSQQQHTDEEIKTKLLNPFLTDLKKVLGTDLLYLWSAEAQPETTQNIHFHIILDRYVCKDWVQNVWNRVQDRLGYVERSGYPNPPSTHIKTHPVNKNTINYLMKYISKTNPKARQIDGKLWACARPLLTINVAVKWIASANDLDCLLYDAVKAGCEPYRPIDSVIYISYKPSQRKEIYGEYYDEMLEESAAEEYAKIAKIVDSYRFVRF